MLVIKFYIGCGLFALSILILGIIQSKHTEKLFGTIYKTKVWKEIGDHEMYYHIKGYSINGKHQFGITLKGVRNDTVLMTTKKLVLKDKIIVTELYHNIPGVDSIKTTLYFRNGKYLKAERVEFANDRSYPGQLKVSDLKEQ